MSMIRTAGLSAAALAALTVSVSPAFAAPEQNVSRAKTESTYAGKMGSGAVYTSDVATALPYCTPLIFDCERTLVKVDDAGKLTFSITTDAAKNPALTDIDLHVFESDASGKEGNSVGESTSATADESVTVAKGKVGYYLIVVDWYLGAGDYSGKVKLVPTPLPPA